MRSLLAPFVILALVGGAAAAQAEKRIFVITNNADGYGVDRCLANGQKCGAEMAAAFCQSRDFKRALSYRKVDRKEITGAVPLNQSACGGKRCEEFVAIECAR